jgi:hypothetical protein
MDLFWSTFRNQILLDVVSEDEIIIQWKIFFMFIDIAHDGERYYLPLVLVVQYRPGRY